MSVTLYLYPVVEYPYHNRHHAPTLPPSILSLTSVYHLIPSTSVTTKTLMYSWDFGNCYLMYEQFVEYSFHIWFVVNIMYLARYNIKYHPDRIWRYSQALILLDDNDFNNDIITNSDGLAPPTLINIISLVKCTENKILECQQQGFLLRTHSLQIPFTIVMICQVVSQNI